MNCEICAKPYNLSDRQPLSTPCCNESLCKECKEKLCGNPQNEFKCPFNDCREITQNANFKITKAIEKFLKQNIGILCDQHPNRNIEYFCEDHELLLCGACILQSHQSHKLAQVNKQSIQDFNNFILDKLKIEQQTIQSLISDIESYQSNEKQLTTGQYLAIIKESQDILIHRLKTQEEKVKLKFMNFNQIPQQHQQNLDLQEEQKVQNERLQIDDSLLIKTKEDKEFIRNCFNEVGLIKYELLSRGTRDGFKSKDFHDRCDNKGPILIVVKSEHNQVFGGYCSIGWNPPIDGSTYQYKSDDKAFLFQLNKKTQHRQYQNTEKALCQYNYGYDNTFAFGYGHDLEIQNKCDKNNESYCNLGHTYSMPNKINVDTEESKNYLAGSFNFKVLEIEVFKVIK